MSLLIPWFFLKLTLSSSSYQTDCWNVLNSNAPLGMSHSFGQSPKSSGTAIRLCHLANISVLTCWLRWWIRWTSPANEALIVQFVPNCSRTAVMSTHTAAHRLHSMWCDAEPKFTSRTFRAPGSAKQMNRIHTPEHFTVRLQCPDVSIQLKALLSYAVSSSCCLVENLSFSFLNVMTFHNHPLKRACFQINILEILEL